MRIPQTISPLTNRLAKLAYVLDLPTKDLIVSIAVPTAIDSEFALDGDVFLEKTLGECEREFPQVAQKFQKEKSKILETSWIKRQYKIVVELILSKLESIAMSSPLALIELSLISNRTPSTIAAIPHLVPWFVRYGELSDLTSQVIQEKLGHRFYRDYVARLPSEELNEFLLSESSEERIMARNKFKLELED